MTVRVMVGDALEQLRELHDDSVHCVVTSPPYWGLRDYGNNIWIGGETDCQHEAKVWNRAARPAGDKSASNKGTRSLTERTCLHCGAEKQPCGVGLEPTLDEHLAALVGVFSEVRRVLRHDGTLWLNYGDAYAGGGRGFGSPHCKQRTNRGSLIKPGKVPGGLKPKDLMFMPARAAMALQEDGWWCRSEIIWHKPNPMPESVTDRPTNAHEKVYLLTKAARYFYDSEGVKQPVKAGLNAFGTLRKGRDRFDNRATEVRTYEPTSVNLRNVWTIPTHGYSEAHFATFPPALVEPCIKAGTSAKGVCGKCGAPWQRKTSTTHENPGNRTTNGDRSLAQRHETAGFSVRLEKRVETTG